MITCPRCGHQNLDSSAACSACGHIFQRVPPRLAVQPIPQPQRPFGNGSLSPQASNGVQCLVCGSALPTQSARAECKTCHTPRGYAADPGDQFCQSWLLPEQISVAPNRSELLLTLQPEPRLLKNRIPGWNWAAAFNSLIWTAKHRGWGAFILCLLNFLFWGLMLVVALVPGGDGPHNSPEDSVMFTFSVILLSSIMFWVSKTVLLGRFGNTLALKSGRYRDEADMLSSQGASGLPQAIFGVVLLAVTVILIFKSGN